VAPFSWYLQRHVDQGRREMNFSEWDRPQHEAHEAPEKVEQGEMPLRSYLLVQTEAKLKPVEREALIRGLKATLALAPGPRAENRGGRTAE
jgi:Haem-binding domain